MELLQLKICYVVHHYRHKKHLVPVRNLPFALAPLERRFVLDGAALIRS